MSARIFADDVLFFQRLLRADGLYLGRLDGVWGPLTERSVLDFENRSDLIASQVRAFDARSENNIRTLSLRAQTVARTFLSGVLNAGIPARIISGTRTYAMQNALYRQGRFGSAGKVVTNARGGQSNHNFGIAWDIGVFTAAGGYIDSGPVYDQAAIAGLTRDLEWGGHWSGFVDKPHYQLRVAESLAQLRAAFEGGTG